MGRYPLGSGAGKMVSERKSAEKTFDSPTIAFAIGAVRHDKVADVSLGLNVHGPVGVALIIAGLGPLRKPLPHIKCTDVS